MLPKVGLITLEDAETGDVVEINTSSPHRRGRYAKLAEERLEAFKPGGILSKRLALTRYSVLQVGSWVFVHGSISPICAKKYTLNDINTSIKNWLLGKSLNNIDDLYH